MLQCGGRIFNLCNNAEYNLHHRIGAQILQAGSQNVFLLENLKSLCRLSRNKSRHYFAEIAGKHGICDPSPVKKGKQVITNGLMEKNAVINRL